MTIFKHKLRVAAAIVAVFQAIAFFFFVASTAFFAHIHALPNGRIIVHCHATPTDDDGRAEHHEHSRYQFIVHHIHSHIDAAPASPVQIPSFVEATALAIVILNDSAGDSVFHSLCNRAPPLYS